MLASMEPIVISPVVAATMLQRWKSLPPRPLAHGGQELPAGLLAAPAGLGAEPAVLIYLGMPLASPPREQQIARLASQGLGKP
jgi:hypothetical protein